jgi:hypothetical protein
VQNVVYVGIARLGRVHRGAKDLAALADADSQNWPPLLLIKRTEENMAIIQMVNEEVIDVTESGEAVNSKISRSPTPVIQLEAKDDNGTRPIWINSAQISSFMG